MLTSSLWCAIMFERSYFMDVEKKKVESESTVKVSATKVVTSVENSRAPCYIDIIISYCFILFYLRSV